MIFRVEGVARQRIIQVVEIGGPAESVVEFDLAGTLVGAQTDLVSGGEALRELSGETLVPVTVVVGIGSGRLARIDR